MIKWKVGRLLWAAIVFVTGPRPTSQALYQVSPEKPLEFKIRTCSSDPTPLREDAMMFFPSNVKYCSSVRTTKNVVSLARDRQRTTFLQPFVQVTLREVSSPHQCHIQYLGYGGEYRLSPDLGYYSTCSKPINKYISELALGSDNPVWNLTNNNCPIQSLPSKYRDYLSCDLVRHRWYELTYKSSIRYEVFHKRRYHQAWANYSTVFLFRPDNFLERAGNELDWLQKLVRLEAKQKNCQRVRYLIEVDDAWPLPITVFIDYKIKEGGFVKYSQHLGNGTVDQWFGGSFTMKRSDRVQELCVQMVWRGSRNRFRLCRTFLQPGECPFPSAAPCSQSRLAPLLFALLFLLLLGH